MKNELGTAMRSLHTNKDPAEPKINKLIKRT